MNGVKKRGFSTLECVISMSILSIIVYMITFSIGNSFNLLSKNEEYIKMLNLAQNCINETKSDIKCNKEYKLENENFYIENFTINKEVSKQEGYYNCYLVRVEVKTSDRSVKLESYVTKK